MPGDTDIASIASLFADPTRAGMLMALSDGRALPAGELARQARVLPSTASSHLAKLVEARLLVVEQQGRHRYFRLASPAIMEVIETLAVLAPTTPIRNLRESEKARAVRRARMCYNHLAGELGVMLTQSLVDKEILTATDGGFLLNADGEKWLREFGVECAAVRKHGIVVVPHHIDWSERRYHIAGEPGAALARRLVELEWVRRIPSNRAVRVTEVGQEAFQVNFGIHLE
jgi:DNA-binding transcriptional ArsR family regulator